MPELNWIGKQAVRAHHREVDFHLLKDVPELASEGEADSGNLIVQGDNLLALKALLPRYAGQVKCIYIDPPYNTGNEGWVYNDNVKAPEIQKWLDKVVGKEAEDLSRHDKWLCMMYPRLQLLKRFLRDDGSIWVTVDDNEFATVRMVMDEIFGRQSFVACVVWENFYGRSGTAAISPAHNYNLVYSPKGRDWKDVRKLLPREGKSLNKYTNTGEDPRGAWRLGPIFAAEERHEGLMYTITTPSGRKIAPPKGSHWRMVETDFWRMVEDGRITFGKNGDNVPAVKLYLSEVQDGVVPRTWWPHTEVGHTQEAKRELQALFGGDAIFDTPKPTRLIQRILQISTDKDSIILDSFAGSGTTGDAVLKQNAEDGGARRFILVEMEAKIASAVTAERVRRVIAKSKHEAASLLPSEEVKMLKSATKDLFNTAPLLANQEAELATGSAVVPMPGFRFAVLGQTLFDSEGNIRETVRFEELAEFVWFQQTGAPLPKRAIEAKPSPLLGIYRGTAVYLLFNGILDDKSVQGGNVLTRPVLYSLPEHDGPKVVWCAACRISELHQRRLNVTPKQLPYNLEVNAWL